MNIWEMELLQNDYRFPHSIYINNNKTIILDVWNGLAQRGRLYCFDQNDFSKYKLLAEHGTYSIDLVGSSSNNLFLSGSFYSTEHFNGASIFYYQEMIRSGTMSGMANYLENVFIVGDTGGQQAVFIHGKL